MKNVIGKAGNGNPNVNGTGMQQQLPTVTRGELFYNPKTQSS
jgi:hypothetical protein